jgi:glycosidase
MTRFFLSVGMDIRKLKMGLAFLLTTRGIPQLYYGTELLMDGDGSYHPNVRKDFPGGWPGDSNNGFTTAGRTADQTEVYEYLKKLLTWRKSQPLIHTGKLLHYIPQDNVYVYFRYDAKKSVMVVLNANEGEKIIDTSPFSQQVKKFTEGNDVITGQEWQPTSTLKILPWTALIVELK